ncbi:PC4 and SFRS1-interacting protein [Teleopsis dalmanni]|uniref:PC4 and SFRS1-interacting protein n=1 Tax=Teleopsis dalmanni TaxID=139649 RepID=UPI0018CF4E1F|nr:PC4 and SFRS1-interacting protein [Teleopsis dalmanni]
MVKEKKQFKIGDLVFAKVKGYPAWPAKITKYNNKKYNVYFYGTGETANIKIEDLFKYEENKEKFSTEKNLKRSNFREAIEQIEAALKGEDSAPIDLPSVALMDTSVGDYTGDDTLASINNSIAVHDTQEVNEIINTPEVLEDVSEEKEIDEVVTEIKDKTQLKDSKNVSRSGRKTKPKRYSEDDNVTAHQAKRKVPKEGIGAADAKVKSSKKVNASKPTATIAPNVKSQNYDNVLLALILPTKCIGIKLDYNKPESFPSVSDRLEWEAEALKEAKELKEKLEIGEIKLESVKDKVILDVPIGKLNAEISADFTSQMVERESALFAERDFLTQCQKLRECLGLKRAYVDKCLELLDNFKKFQLNQLMLLRNPDCVDIIRRLRRYVGNLKQWNLSSDEEARFKTNAEIIRQDAITIYNNFKRLFNYNGEKQFWDEFTEHAKEFKEVTRNLGEQHRVFLTENVYQKLLAKRENVTREEHESNSQNSLQNEEEIDQLEEAVNDDTHDDIPIDA